MSGENALNGWSLNEAFWDELANDRACQQGESPCAAAVDRQVAPVPYRPITFLIQKIKRIFQVADRANSTGMNWFANQNEQSAGCEGLPQVLTRGLASLFIADPPPDILTEHSDRQH